MVLVYSLPTVYLCLGISQNLNQVGDDVDQRKTLVATIGEQDERSPGVKPSEL
jgi:hypothetical protein